MRSPRRSGSTAWPWWRHGTGEVAASPGPAQPLPPLRRLLHALLIVLGWLLFAWSWLRVTADRPAVGELKWLMLAALLVVPVLTLSWVAHNVGIYRRKGPRRAVTPVAVQHDVDFNGRRIEADWPALASARCIEIVIDGEAKRFVAKDMA
ncbi:MAG: hypothetical protein LCI02_08885 [Proteobacteria bacterium]|nr:hypothetical protein [Pseudomonadota bacterium]